jgi:hypothetical protein
VARGPHAAPAAALSTLARETLHSPFSIFEALIEATGCTLEDDEEENDAREGVQDGAQQLAPAAAAAPAPAPARDTSPQGVRRMRERIAVDIRRRCDGSAKREKM